ncbi:hypothetical protein Glove_13g126 [Diversispora epigaea]|uniref:Uncharacterized protein n=1 Tax=Diversispora epigaea TaxID=1348612 RepID=A0A397JRU2_9GLOM|nr:hypothetical protein Glove_13g126 [Diversispora epigaea]
MNQEFQYYQMELSDRLRLSFDQLEILRGKASIRLRESFEECAIQLHHHTPQDELDKGMFCLFANKR